MSSVLSSSIVIKQSERSEPPSSRLHNLAYSLKYDNSREEVGSISDSFRRNLEQNESVMNRNPDRLAPAELDAPRSSMPEFPPASSAAQPKFDYHKRVFTHRNIEKYVPTRASGINPMHRSSRNAAIGNSKTPNYNETKLTKGGDSEFLYSSVNANAPNKRKRKPQSPRSDHTSLCEQFELDDYSVQIPTAPVDTHFLDLSLLEEA